MRRNCSVSPQVMGCVFATIGLMSLSISTAFFALGAPIVLFYSVLLCLGLAATFLVYARQATDTEAVILTQHTVVLEQELRGNRKSCTFSRSQLRISLDARRRDGISISNGIQTIRIGCLLSPEARRDLYEVLRLQLHSASPEQCTHRIHHVLSASGVCQLSFMS